MILVIASTKSFAGFKNSQFTLKRIQRNLQLINIVIDTQETKKNQHKNHEPSLDESLDLELKLANQIKKYKTLSHITAFFVAVSLFASLLIGMLLVGTSEDPAQLEKNTLRSDIFSLIRRRRVIRFVSLNQLKKDSLRSEVLNLIEQRSIRDFPDEKTLLESELRGLVSSLDDPYSSYFPAVENENFQNSLNQRYEGVGILFETVEGQIIVQQVFKGSPAQKAEISNGDILQKVDGEDIRNQDIGSVAERIRGEKGTKVKLEFLRNFEVLEFEVTRERIELELISLEFLENDTVAHLRISSFGDNLSVLMEDKIQQIKAKDQVENIVLDLRDNSGGLLDQTVEVASYFIPENQVVLIEEAKTGEKILRTTVKEVNLHDYEITILVNDFSASASEILAGALRDQRGSQLIGQTTFGKGTVQQIFNLRNGDKLKLTIAEWFTPERTVIDQVGLEVDVLVAPEDDILEAALELLGEN